MNKICHLVSFATVTIFVLIAFASVGPDASTNTSVAISDCETKPPLSDKVQVTIFLQTEEGDGEYDPISAPGKLLIVHQKVNPDNSCTYTSTKTVVDFQTGFDGRYIYSGENWTHDNSQDLYRVEVLVPGSLIGGYGPYKEVGVRYYGASHFAFGKVLPGVLSSE